MNNLLKKILIGLCVIFVFTACETEQKNKNTFTLEGEIKGLTTHLFYRHPDKEYSREKRQDTIFVENGKFKFSDTISKFSMIRAFTDFEDKENKIYKKPSDGGFFPVKSMYLMFYVFPGANVKVDGEAIDFINAYPSGDEYNNSLAAINKVTFPNYNEVGNLMVEASYEKDSLKIKEIEQKAEELSENGRIERINFLEMHPNSLAAVWYLDDMMKRRHIEDEKAIEIFNNISKDLAEFDIYKNVESRVTGVLATKEGSPVPEIKTTSTLNGKEFDIASIKGKYILIDFWGVWCGPCVAEMPKVKAFQEKHKEKLVVLGINSGDKKEKIQNFIEENDYSWQQVMSSRSNLEDNFVTKFNVKGFPTKFIVSPEGKIVKRFMGSGEEAFELLEELLKE